MKDDKIVQGAILFFILVALPIVTGASGCQQERPNLSLSWSKSGGIMGLLDYLEVDAAGNADYTSNFYGEFHIKLSIEEHNELADLLGNNNFFDLSQDSFPPCEGCADFFSYFLNATLDGSNKAVSWFDPWANNDIPDELHAIQAGIESFINRY